MSYQTSADISNHVHMLTAHPEVGALLADWEQIIPSLISEALAIQAVPAPTFEESRRADFVLARLKNIGLADVSLDKAGNVWARTPGRKPELPGLMVSAHLDTVFAADTDLTSRHDRPNGRIYAPGLGDNSLGLAAMLALARQMGERAIIPQSDIWWVATVGEEGLGDLRGMRQACSHLNGRLGAVIVLEGLGLGRVYNAGLGVRRIKIEVHGPGGHSWLHSERPSAIHQLIAIGAALMAKVQPSDTPKSTFNIGLIDGGDSINSRASRASLSIDLRSEDAGLLAAMERSAMVAITHTPCHPALTVSTRVIGDRPFGRLRPDHPLIATALAVLDELRWDATTLDIGSTDANIPLSQGIPAVCIGLTTGSNAHTLDENVETQPLPLGMRQLTLLTLAATDQMEQWPVR